MMVKKAEEGGPTPPPIVVTLDVPPEVEAEALAGALPAWDLVPEAPFLRRR
jgi:hypothetical protein